MILVTAQSYPALHAALKMIEVDNGGHLIGTLYPGEKIDLENFQVADMHRDQLDKAELVLAVLKSASAEHFEAFVVGEYACQVLVAEKYLGLSTVHDLLNDFFDGGLGG